METNIVQNRGRNPPRRYTCTLCEYTTTSGKDFIKHEATRKHQRKQDEANGRTISRPVVVLRCEHCELTYTSRVGLWKHKKKCPPPAPASAALPDPLPPVVAAASEPDSSPVPSAPPDIPALSQKADMAEPIDWKLFMSMPSEVSDKQLMMILFQQNHMLMEQQRFLAELSAATRMQPPPPTCTHHVETNHNNIQNNHHIQTNNVETMQSFNLNFFLNETCKNAMNMSDFVESIHLQLSDLVNVGQLGYVDGISDIIIKNLKALDITERPIHCTDRKRETFYVKEQDRWAREGTDNRNLRSAIQRVANLNLRMLPQYRETHPDCGRSDSQFSDQYNKIIVETMTGSATPADDKTSRIIRNISRLVAIDKRVVSP